MFYYMFHAPQVKWNLIFNIINLIYKLPHELLKDLKLRMLGNEEILEKSQNCMGTQSSVQAPLRYVFLALVLKKYAIKFFVLV